MCEEARAECNYTEHGIFWVDDLNEVGRKQEQLIRESESEIHNDTTPTY